MRTLAGYGRDTARLTKDNTGLENLLRVQNISHGELPDNYSSGDRKWDNYARDQYLGLGRPWEEVKRETDVGRGSQYDWQLKHRDHGNPLLGKIITLAGAALGGPGVGALLGGTFGGGGKGPTEAILGGISGFGAGGGFNPIIGGLKDALGIGKGFTNLGGMGLDGSNLSLPGLTNAPPTTAIGGYGPGAIGGSLNIPGIINAGTSFIPQPGLEGLTPSSLYNPQSLNPIQQGPGSKIDKVVKAIKTAANVVSKIPQAQDEGGPLQAGPPVGARPAMGLRSPLSTPFKPIDYPGLNTNPFMARIY